MEVFAPNIKYLIFDRGLNLTNNAKFDTEIVEELSKTKTEIIKILYKYQSS